MMKELWIELETDEIINHFFETYFNSSWQTLESIDGEPNLKIVGQNVPQTICEAEELSRRALFNLNAIAKLLVGYSGCLPRSKGFALIDENGERHAPTLSAKVKNHTHVSATLGDLTEERAFVSNCIDLGNTHTDVCEALRFLAYDPNWVNLYKVYEIVRKNIGGRTQIIAKRWWTNDEEKSFRTSANDYRVSGDDARHAREHGEPPPQQSISIKQGVELINRLVKCWLLSKSNT